MSDDTNTNQSAAGAPSSLPVVNAAGDSVGTMDVPRAALGTYVRPTLIHRAVIRYGSNRRAGTASTKTRAEVNFGNRKPWPQKGTGRARAGSRRSPLWRGGGVIFGPKPRDYTSGMNKKQRRLAMRSALLWKIADGQVIVVDSLELDEPKTRLAAQIFERLGVTGSCLVGLEDVPRNVLLAFRNLPGVKVIPVREFNAYDIVRKKRVVLTKGGLEAILAGKGKAGDGDAPPQASAEEEA